MSSSATMRDLSTFGPAQAQPVSLSRAQHYVRRFTRSRSENFMVLSALLPRPLREPFAAIYAFCRWADDLADETASPSRSIELLQWWQQELDRCFLGRPQHPVFVALLPVIEHHELPREPFDELIEAFLQDQRITCYENWDQLLAYCRLSANPVGRLVLCLCGCRGHRYAALSDATCTALQLTNFWQDVQPDLLRRGRIYIPDSIARRHGLNLAALTDAVRQNDTAAPQMSRLAHDPEQVAAYKATLHELVCRTWPLFEKGRELWPLVPRGMRPTVRLFTLGGENVLRQIERMEYQTLWRRPGRSPACKLVLLVRGLIGA